MRSLILSLLLLAGISNAYAEDPFTQSQKCDPMAFVIAPRCMPFGLELRYHILAQTFERAVATNEAAILTAETFVVTSPISGMESGIVIQTSGQRPEKMSGPLFTSVQLYVMEQFLEQRDGYAALQHAAFVQYCSLEFAQRPPAQSGSERAARRLASERCAYGRISPDHFADAARKEAKLGDDFFAPYKDLSNAEIRASLRERFGEN